MSKVLVGAPFAKVEFATEEGQLTISQKQKIKDDNMDFDIYSINTDRDVGAEDCPTFTVVLAYKEKWYKQVGSNDLVIINLGRGEEAKPVMFGMVDSIKKTWSFQNLKPVRTITITGRGFNKAFIQFGIGAVTEISGNIFKSVGFFDGQDKGFSEAGPAELVKTALDFYMEKGIDISFANGKSLNDYINLILLESTDGDETLGNVKNYYSYQGGLWEYLKELRNAPFYEMYWEVIDDKPSLVTRPTPFNPEEWTNLQKVSIDDIDIIDESMGRSDLETYTVYSVKSESIAGVLDMLYGQPVWYRPFYKKYGLRRLQVQSKYIPLGEKENVVEAGGAQDSSKDDDFDVNTTKAKEDMAKIQEDQKLNKEYEEIARAKAQTEVDKKKEEAQNKSNMISAVGEMTGFDTSAHASSIRERADKESKETMDSLESDIEEANQASSSSSVSKKTINLFNWNIHNNNFENGNLILRGNNIYKVGTRAVLENKMEYYIEHVSHSFVYNEQWTTTLEVTRGMEYGTRFQKPWNEWEIMKPEDLAEISGMDVETIMQNIAETNDTSMDMGRPATGPAPKLPGFAGKMAMAAEAHRYEKYNSGGLRNSPGYSDCSSFVYRVVMEAQGRKWQGTSAATTRNMDSFPHLWRKMDIPVSEAQPWDILWRDGHVEFLGSDGKTTYGQFDWGKVSGPGYQFRPNEWRVVYRPVGL